MSAADPNLYDRAVYFVTHDRKASTSYLQRKLQIGYNNAAALMEHMESAGIVSPADHVGKREILVGPVDAVPATADAPIGVTSADSAHSTPVKNGPVRPAPTGPSRTVKCSGCNLQGLADGEAPPRGWYIQTSGKLGSMLRCPSCAEKNATRIATEHMTTEQILNAGSDGAEVDAITGAANERLRTIVQRCQNLLGELADVREDFKEVLSEAKGEGFDVKIIRKLLAEMQKDPAKRREEAEMLDLYATSIGVEL